MARDNKNDPTPYAVICDGDCGLLFLDEDEYMRQLRKPNQGWQCPRCGDSARWDNDCQVTGD